MNITKPEQCLEQWEIDLILNGNQDNIPPEERDRIEHEVDTLYNEMYDLLRIMGDTSYDYFI